MSGTVDVYLRGGAGGGRGMGGVGAFVGAGGGAGVAGAVVVGGLFRGGIVETHLDRCWRCSWRRVPL